MAGAKKWLRASEPELAAVKVVLALLASEARRTILVTLAEQPLGAPQLVRSTKLSQSTIRHHLRRLEDAEFVYAQRQGRVRTYRLAECVKVRRSRLEIQLEVLTPAGSKVTVGVPLQQRPKRAGR